MGAWSGRPMRGRPRAPAGPSPRPWLQGELADLAAITVAGPQRPSDPGASVPIVASPPISGSGLLTPTLAPTPARTDGASPVVVALEEDVELFVGGSAAVEGMDVTLTLLDARGPEAGCSDCPNRVRLRVACPARPA